jgi:hypothetical protein
MKHNPLLTFLSGAFLFGFSFASAFSAPRTFAAEQMNPFVQTKTDNKICPLSDSQQERAQQAFAEIDRMLRSSPPRCINCHGGIQPFREGTKHPGGRLGWVHDEKGRRNLLATRQGQCVLCHDPPWQAPVGDDFWTDKDAVQLCRHFRQQFDTAPKFFNHIETDPLADIAFAGTRALNDNGQVFSEMEFGRPYTPEPPSFVRADLRLVSGVWVDTMGGEFKGGESCGCQPHHYVLKGSFDEIWTKEEGPLHFTGHSELQIPLQFHDDGSFDGETMIDVAEANTFTASVMSCSESISYSGVSWKAKGSIDDSGVMHVTISVQFPVSELKTVCTAGGITTTDSLPNTRPEQTMDFSGSITVGDTFTVEDPYPQGGSLTAQFTVIEEGR